MKKERLATRVFLGFALPAAVLALSPLMGQPALAQYPELQQKLAAVKEAAAKNKQALAQYAWTERQTISLKGEVKKQTTYEVRLGPDGQPQKTEVAAMPQSSGGRREGRLKEHVKEKKKEEFEEYGQQLAALAHQYAQPDPQRMQQAFQQGNLTLGSAGAPGEIRMVIKNYIKPNDNVTLVFNQQTKALQSLQVASYLKDPKDAVEISAQFAQLPDGTNHVANMIINGVSKKLTVATQNSDYQKL
jgi:hypothetical protein